MSVVVILLISSLALATAFLAAFIWSVKAGQYDDDYTPSVRILFDDKKAEPESNTQNITTTKQTNGTRQDSSDRETVRS